MVDPVGRQAGSWLFIPVTTPFVQLLWIRIVIHLLDGMDMTASAVIISTEFNARVKGLVYHHHQHQLQCLHRYVTYSCDL